MRVMAYASLFKCAFELLLFSVSEVLYYFPDALYIKTLTWRCGCGSDLSLPMSISTGNGKALCRVKTA